MLIAKLVFAALCVLDAASKMVAAAELVARRAGAAGALLLSKLELASRPALDRAAMAAAQYSQLLRRADLAGVMRLAAAHASLTASTVQPMAVSLSQAVCAHLPAPCRTARRGPAACLPCRALHASTCPLVCCARACWTSLDAARRLPAATCPLCAWARLPPAAASALLAAVAGLLLVSIAAVLFV